MGEYKFKLSDPQMRFVKSEKKFPAFIGGLGSGKTFAGALKVITFVQENENVKGIIISNTYAQLNRVALATLKDILDGMKIPWKHNKLEQTFSFMDAMFYCCTADNYEMIRGVEVGIFWADEARDFKRECFEVLMGRLRQQKIKRYCGAVTSTPKGYNFIYDFFHPSGDNHNPDEFEMITSKTTDNLYLPDGYYETLLGSYDSVLAEQELDAGFVSVGQGKVYYAFNREKNVKPVKRVGHVPIYAGMDFNINPMTSSVAHLVNNGIRVFAEHWIMTSDTAEMSEVIRENYGRVTIVPDSTGKRKQTSSGGLSDLAILRNNGHEVPDVSNPFRIDRYNNVNRLLESGKVIIDPSCKKLINDLEKCSYKEGTNVLNSTPTNNLGHISDGFGYLLYWAYPNVSRGKVTVRKYA